MNTKPFATRDIWDQIYEGQVPGLDHYFEGIVSAQNLQRYLDHFKTVFQSLSLICETTPAHHYPLQIGRKLYQGPEEIATDLGYLAQIHHQAR